MQITSLTVTLYDAFWNCGELSLASWTRIVTGIVSALNRRRERWEAEEIALLPVIKKNKEKFACK